MAIEEGTFEILQPSQYICFTYPNPCNRALLLTVSVLDSAHFHPAHNATIAAMLVPHGREDDWIFSSLSGHHQLLNSAQVSRLILFSTKNKTNSFKYIKQGRDGEKEEDLKTCLGPLLLALSPRIAFQGGIPHIPFLSYTDNIVHSRVLEIFSSLVTGKMLVENVEIEIGKGGEVVTEWRRRLRFERMPNLVQTEVALLKEIVGDGHKQNLNVDRDRLVHPYLSPIVDGLVLVGDMIDCSQNPKFLCIGVGGGALPVFLNRHFGWISIVGVEKDEIVLKAAKKYFGLVENERLRINVGDGLQAVQQIAQKVATNHPKNPNSRNPNSNPKNPNPENQNSGAKEKEYGVGDFEDDPRVDVIIVDVDAGDAKTALNAPPMEFVEKGFLLSARMALHPRGIMAMNVIPPANGECFYNDLISTFGEVFSDMYDIQVNDQNYVLLASPSSIDRDKSISSAFAKKVKQVTGGEYLDRIRHHVLS